MSEQDYTDDDLLEAVFGSDLPAPAKKAIADRLADKSDRAQLASKLVDVMEAVKAVKNTGYNDFNNYSYPEEGAIVAKIRKELADRNVMVSPETSGISRNGDLTTIHLEYTFTDGDTGAEITKRWYGEGKDKQDKGIYKSYTGATKYFLLKTFLIPTGDDPEQFEDIYEDEGDGGGQQNSRQQQSSGGQSGSPGQRQGQDGPWYKHDLSNYGDQSGEDRWDNASGRFHALLAEADVAESRVEQVRERIKELHNVSSWKQIHAWYLEKWNARIAEKSAQSQGGPPERNDWAVEFTGGQEAA